MLGGLYGASMGLWRSPLQAAFVAVKLPAAILVTVAGTTLANSMLSQALGLNISLRHSATLVLASFAIAAAILASFVPVSLFLLLNVPPFGSGREALGVSIVTVAHVFLVAIAGTTANAVLYNLLKNLAGPRSGRRILFAWLSVNLFLGAQVMWNMRPFIGSPALEVQFMRQDAFAGSFYEDVFVKLMRIFGLEDR